MSTWFGAPWPSKSNRVMPEELSPAFVLLQQRCADLADENEQLRAELDAEQEKHKNAAYEELSHELNKSNDENARLAGQLHVVGAVMVQQEEFIRAQGNIMRDQTRIIDDLRAQLARSAVPADGIEPPPPGPNSP